MNKKLITTIKLEHAVKNRPHLFFGNNKPCAQMIVDEIVSGAKVLGAKNILCIEYSSWNVIFSDLDWLYLGQFPNPGESIWNAPFGFPRKRG